MALLRPLTGRLQQTIGNGVNVRCLINLNIRMGGLIRLNHVSLYHATLSTDEIGRASGTAITQNQQPALINTDGDSIVGCIDSHGDTKGNAWYLDMLCVAKDSVDLINGRTIFKCKRPGNDVCRPPFAPAMIESTYFLNGLYHK
ncbi:TPA: hypothetical protein KEY88_005371 [Serratia marcescens]|nr:hypothetical protein [Serratia marcescens]